MFLEDNEVVESDHLFNEWCPKTEVPDSPQLSSLSVESVTVAASSSGPLTRTESEFITAYEALKLNNEETDCRPYLFD